MNVLRPRKVAVRVLQRLVGVVLGLRKCERARNRHVRTWPHENEIGATTDVARRFPDRKRTKRIDGTEVTGWFTEDFTLAEIKTLRANERLRSRSHQYDGQFEVPTFDQVIDLAQELGRPVGVYPETKHPAYFQSIGLPLEDRLLNALASHAERSRDAVFIQSFETSLRELRGKTSIRLIRLIDDHLPTDAVLADIKTYADGIGPSTRLIVPANPDRTLREPNDLVERAHAAGLLVHVWTLRAEPEFLSPTYRGSPGLEFLQFRDLGVDGIFTDFPDLAVLALRNAAAR